jgi:hypothetical protein
MFEKFGESIIGGTALSWLKILGYTNKHGLDIASSMVSAAHKGYFGGGVAATLPRCVAT